MLSNLLSYVPSPTPITNSARNLQILSSLQRSITKSTIQLKSNLDDTANFADKAACSAAILIIPLVVVLWPNIDTIVAFAVVVWFTGRPIGELHRECDGMHVPCKRLCWRLAKSSRPEIESVHCIFPAPFEAWNQAEQNTTATTKHIKHHFSSKHISEKKP